MNRHNMNIFSWIFPIIAFGIMGFIVFIFREGLLFTNGELNFQENSIYKIMFCIFFAISIIVPIVLLILVANTKKNTRKFGNDKEFYGNSNFAKIWKVYAETFEPLQYANKKISRANADLYFTVESTTNLLGIPLAEVLKIISGTFIGLGILGTFIGFSNAISADFSIQSIKTIEDLNPIFSGLKTAFSSSIVGVFCSVIYNFFVVHAISQELSDSVKKLSDDIDKEYYKSETEIIVTELHKNDEKNANFVNSMNSLTNSLNTASSEFNKTVKNIKDLNSELKNSIEKLQNEFKTEISKFTETISSELKNNLSDFEKSVNNFSNKISDSTLTITNSVDSVSKIPEKLELIKESFDGIVFKVSEQTTNTVGEIMEGIRVKMDNAFVEITTNLDDSVSSMRENFKSISDTASADISNCVESVKEKFDGISLDIQTSLNQNVTDSLGQMREFVHESSKTMREEVSNATVDMAKSVNEAVRSAADDVKNLNESLNVAVVKAVQQVDETVEKVSYIPEKISGITSTISELDKNIIEVEKMFNENVTMISDIPDRVRKFNESLKEYDENVLVSYRNEAANFSRTLKKQTDGFSIAMKSSEASASKFYDAVQAARTMLSEFEKFLNSQKGQKSALKEEGENI